MERKGGRKTNLDGGRTETLGETSDVAVRRLGEKTVVARLLLLLSTGDVLLRRKKDVSLRREQEREGKADEPEEHQREER
jgi:hypothetical protein